MIIPRVSPASPFGASYGLTPHDVSFLSLSSFSASSFLWRLLLLIALLLRFPARLRSIQRELHTFSRQRSSHSQSCTHKQLLICPSEHLLCRNNRTSHSWRILLTRNQKHILACTCWWRWWKLRFRCMSRSTGSLLHCHRDLHKKSHKYLWPSSTWNPKYRNKNLGIYRTSLQHIKQCCSFCNRHRPHNCCNRTSILLNTSTCSRQRWKSIALQLSGHT